MNVESVLRAVRVNNVHLARDSELVSTDPELDSYGCDLVVLVCMAVIILLSVVLLAYSILAT
jgi:hypothetical protein